MPAQFVLLPGQQPCHPTQGGPARGLLLLPPHPLLLLRHQPILPETDYFPLPSPPTLSCASSPTPSWNVLLDGEINLGPVDFDSFPTLCIKKALEPDLLEYLVLFDPWTNSVHYM